MKFISVLFFLILANFSFSQVVSPDIIFSKDNFTIKYPENWILDTSRSMGTELIIFSSIENADDKFTENVNLIIQDLSGQSINLEKYKQISDEQLQGFFSDLKVHESLIIKSENREYFKLTYEMSQGIFKLMITSVCFIEDDKAYLLTLTSEIDKLDTYKKIGEEILHSFNFLKN